MSNLDTDMQRYVDEFYSKKDLTTGLKLVLKAAIELGGFFAVIYATASVLSMLSGVLAWIGIPLSIGVARQIIMIVGRSYATASTEDRKALRAVASWIHGGFSFEHFVEGDTSVETIAKVVEIAENAESIVDAIEKRADAD